MAESKRLADLRRSPVPHNDDLREWRFRDVWLHNDTTTVLAWAGDEGCVLHEDVCPHSPRGEPTEKGRMDEARELFAVEQPKGNLRYFSFCGHCLVERDRIRGFHPTSHDLELLENLRQRLNDVRLLEEASISWAELMTRMRRYGGTGTRAELIRLLDYDRRARGDENDLSRFVSG